MDPNSKMFPIFIERASKSNPHYLMKWLKSYYTETIPMITPTRLKSSITVSRTISQGYIRDHGATRDLKRRHYKREALNPE